MLKSSVILLILFSLFPSEVNDEGVVESEMTDAVIKEVCLMDNDCRLLVEAGYKEARSESDAGVVAVMYTILERKKDPHRWGNNIEDVLSAKNQFEYRANGAMMSGFKDTGQVDRIAKLAYGVLVGDIINPVPKANHFHTTKLKRVWTKNMRVVAVIGNHVFFEG